MDAERSWLHRGEWPGHWISCAGGEVPYVMIFRLRFSLPEQRVFRIHVAADECYDLLMDGKFVGSGSERGAPHLWFFDSYDLTMGSGDHVLAARVWALGPAAPRAQMSLRPGFLLSPDDRCDAPLLATGVAAWEGKLLRGYSFSSPFSHPYYSIGHNVTVHAGTVDSEWRTGSGEGWEGCQIMYPGSDAIERTRIGGEHLLSPATLPASHCREYRGGIARHAFQGEGQYAPDFREENHQPALAREWELLWKEGSTLVIPPQMCTRILLDFQDYVCAYTEVMVSGGQGSEILIHWAESLFCNDPGVTDGSDQLGAHECPKGNRSEIQGKFFRGVGETFFPDGRSEFLFDSPFWRAGRYLLVDIRTSEAALEIRRFTLSDTRYPLEYSGDIRCDDPRIAPLITKARRTFSASCHDTWVDPYYEQMMWAGDGIQNLLFNMVSSPDARLAEKWLRLLAASRLPSGLTCARYPARDHLLIAPYSLYWVQGLREYAWWRDNLPLVRELLPMARGVLMAFERFLNPDGLLGRLPGWNFVDWVEGWNTGIPPGADEGPCGILHWHYVATLTGMAELEDSLGELEMAARHRRMATLCAGAAGAAFWNEERGLFADDTRKTRFSEHAQCFALLSGCLDAVQSARVAAALVGAPDLKRATMGFSHHLFEVLGRIGRIDCLFGRLQPWFETESLGLITLPEAPEPSRSDCHSWSTNPVFHLVATIFGIRPDGPGFGRVIVRPQPGPLKMIEVTLPHPYGLIQGRLDRHEGRISGEITLPPGLAGRMVSGGKAETLRGKTIFDLPC